LICHHSIKDLSDPQYFKLVQTIDQMKALVQQYHDRISLASKSIVGPAAIAVAQPNDFKPSDTRFLGVQPTGTVDAGAVAKAPTGGPGTRRAAPPAKAACLQSPPSAKSRDSTVVIDDGDEDAPSDFGSRRGSFRVRSASASVPAKRTAITSQSQSLPVVLEDTTRTGVINAFFSQAPIAARLLAGKRRYKGEVDPKYIVSTSLHLGNQVQGACALVASER
jgi:hypothetical protein